MEVIKVKGGNLLEGDVKIGGAKNSAVALIPAAILGNGEVHIDGIPQISDIQSLKVILEEIGCGVKFKDDEIIVDSSNVNNIPLVSENVKKLRASYYFMGAMLSRYKKVTMGFPGGCYLGPRPIDLHIKGFEALGAEVNVENGVYEITADELTGAEIFLDFASVGATINIMLAAVTAKGKTLIENAAKEPEIIDVATLLNNMGAKIRGAGTSVIRIEGVEELHGCYHQVIPDRIEAGTYIIAAALAGKKVNVTNVIPHHLEALISKLKDAGVVLDVLDDSVVVYGGNKLKATDIKTQIFPGFPTDLQQPITTLLTQSEGTSVVEESIYSDRLRHCKHLSNMGADIRTLDNTSIITGPNDLNGQIVEATDLRSGASLILAGLIADGVTEVRNIGHVLRGYEKVISKFTNLGAEIWIDNAE
jgi:UDP-N-acetylglucosamine 1-carboxyvinyltransferase